MSKHYLKEHIRRHAAAKKRVDDMKLEGASTREMNEFLKRYVASDLAAAIEDQEKIIAVLAKKGDEFLVDAFAYDDKPYDPKEWPKEAADYMGVKLREAFEQLLASSEKMMADATAELNISMRILESFEGVGTN